MSETTMPAQQLDIELTINGRTLCDQLRDTADRYPGEPAFSRRVDEAWQTLTWGETRQQVLELAAGFLACGLEPGEAVALMMPNRPEHVLADLGAVHAGGVPTSFYGTLAPEQVTYIANNSSSRVAVLDGADQLDRWQQVLTAESELRKVIVVDAAACPADELFMTWDDFVALGQERLAAETAELDRRRQGISPEHPLTIVYTSGTTGHPKGVIITHRMALQECHLIVEVSKIPLHGAGVSYLPFAHIADRVLSLYLPVVRASHIHFCPDPALLGAVLREVRPQLFLGVPRVWEKLMAGVQHALAAQPEDQRAAVTKAMDAGRAYIESRQYGFVTPSEVAETFQRADAAALSPIRALIGLDRTQTAMSGSAPLPLEVGRFFAGLGLPIYDVYGMTETTAAVTANSAEAFKLGTAGRPMTGVELQIAGDGEILIRGGTCTPGYLGRPGATADLIDADGWVHTGDIGVLDADGFLSVVDRKKELIITSGGENIAPSLIEGHLKEHPIIGQALAYGDQRPYVVAVLTLDGEVAPGWAQAHGIDNTHPAALAQHPLVLEEVATAVATANERLARVQQVKHWRLLAAEWTAETEELTPSLKLKRRVIHTKYADTISAMYLNR